MVVDQSEAVASKLTNRQKLKCANSSYPSEVVLGIIVNNATMSFVSRSIE